MSKAGYGLGALVLGAIGLTYWYKGVAASRLTFAVGIPQNITFSGDGIKFTLPINATNVDTTALTITKGAVKNFVGTKQLGTGYLPTSITIKPKATTTIPAQITLTNAELFQSLGTLWAGIKKLSLSMTAEGFFEASGLTFNFSLPYTLSKPY